MKKTFLLINLSIIGLCKAQLGTIDPTFASGTGLNSGGNCITLSSAGKIIVGGYFNDYNGNTVSKIVSINNNGSIDNSLTGITSGFNGPVNKIIEQPDGKLLCGGGFTTFNGNSRKYLIRLNSDGTEDLTFNTGLGFNSNVLCMILQPDGKIIVGGQFGYYNGSNIYKCIIRLNSDGSVDNTFNSGTGFSRTLTGGGLMLYSMALQADGKIITAGEFDTYNGVVMRNIARLNSDGSLDNTFQIGLGLQSTAGGSDAKCIELQNDGKILVTGKFNTYNSASYNGIVRLNSNGSTDSSFNIGTGFLNPGYSFGYKVLSMQDSSIIVSNSGSSSINSQSITSVCVLNYNGSLKHGNVFNFGNFDIVYDAAIQNDGKIIFIGSFTFYDNVIKNNIVRVNGLLTTNLLDIKEHNSLFSVYPNPTEDILNIRINNFNDNNKIIITNALGEIILSENALNNIIELKTNNLSKGVYFITISNNEQKITQKIIKK